MKVIIVDVGIGNIASLCNCLKFLGVSFEVSNEKNFLYSSSHIILPGVGSFDSFILAIKKYNILEDLIKNIIDLKKPFLGICVGMQILMKSSQEGKEKGFGILDSDVKKLLLPINNHQKKVPHVGFSNITGFSKKGIFKNLEKKEFFYFTHSYAVPRLKEDNINIAYTEHNNKFISAFQKDNLCGVQFHPEKSQTSGMKIISNFLTI
jgi:glutamine amidotransferase